MPSPLPLAQAAPILYPPFIQADPVECTLRGEPYHHCPKFHQIQYPNEKLTGPGQSSSYCCWFRIHWSRALGAQRQSESYGISSTQVDRRGMASNRYSGRIELWASQPSQKPHPSPPQQNNLGFLRQTPPCPPLILRKPQPHPSLPSAQPARRVRPPLLRLNPTRWSCR